LTLTIRWCLLASLAVTAGCSDAMNAGPVGFESHERLTGEEFAAKPTLKQAVAKATADLYGESPNRLKVPAGSRLPAGGRYLGNYSWARYDEQAPGDPKRIAYAPAAGEPGSAVPVEGGQALYRRHCLHCHGVSGDGKGPTARFLFPRPRDFRLGKFKFTSTPYGAKPTRDDLRKTLRNGVHGSAMPSFTALMTPQEIEQVIDYTIFLSLRGETEWQLIEIAASADDADPEAVTPDLSLEIAQGVADQWARAGEQVVAPGSRRVASTPDSIARGKQLFLGLTTEKLECSGCHGKGGIGDGASYIDVARFNYWVFGGDPTPERTARLKEIAEAEKKRWGDDWGDPLRPANLNRGVYKGGRRPLDLYWRIAKGITGTPMPAHSSLKPEQVWDLVNFVLALPYQQELLIDQATAAEAVASADAANPSR